MSLKSHVVFFSPNGSTKLIGETIYSTLNDLGHQTELYSLNKQKKIDLGNINPGDCLWIGSPIYFNYALPQALDFISSLPQGDGAYAVVFVTYGLVTGGMGLFNMGEALMKKGYTVLGAAKVPAVHSLLLACDTHLGQGRPNHDDLDKVRELVRTVDAKLQAEKEPAGLIADDLNYHPEQVRSLFQASFEEMKKKSPPMKVDPALCTDCGACMDVCPTNNITLDPRPAYGPDCVFCFNCLRSCEYGAIFNDMLKVVEGHIFARKKEFSEPEEVRIIV